MHADSDASDHARSHTLRALSERVATGDRAAFNDLHQRLAAGLKAVFLKRGGYRRDLADELRQQTWTQVWRAIRLRRYDPQRAAISTFVYAVAHNIWLQYCRSLHKRSVEADPPEPEFTGRVEDHLQYSELLEALRGCLRIRKGPNALTPQEHEIAVAAARGASERALGRTLKLAASTINARKKSGYEKIRRCLEQKGFGPEFFEQLELERE